MRVFFTTLVSSSILAISASAQESCDAILRVAKTYTSQYSEQTRAAMAYSELCGASMTNQSSGASIIFDSLNVGLTHSEAENSKWCEENASLQLGTNQLALMKTNVFEPAVTAWERCKVAYSSGLEVVPNLTANGKVADFAIRNRTVGTEAEVFGVFIQPSDLVTCNMSSSGDGVIENVSSTDKVALPPSQFAFLNCEISETDRDGVKILPSGSISINTTIGQYTFPFAEINLEPVEQRPEKIVVYLKGRVEWSEAWWENKRKSTGRMRCTKKDMGVPAQFEIVGVETKIENKGSQNDMTCNKWPWGGLCDSSGEGPCNDAVITKGCAINPDWHAWYKRQNQELGLPYSVQAVCSD